MVTNTGSNLNAGGNLVLNARNDLTIEGSDVSAGDQAVLKAVNDVRIVSAQDHTRSTLDEEHLSGGAGVNFGSDGIGFTAYVAAGENDLDRQNTTHRNSTVNAGNGLTIISGNDTDISGANLHSKVVDMDVGGNLTVASQQDTGSVEGKRWDVSASATVGAGVSVSANVGYGETEGSSAWVEQQTSIIGTEAVNIKVGGHTQIDGALIANIKEDGTDGGNLVLDTGTLGYTNLKDHHEETSSYLSIGFSTGGNSSTNDSDKDGSWSVSGSYSDLDRKQETNATVGQGVLRVRNDEETGADSTVGLNRDIDTAQVVTRDKETGFDLYVTSTAIDSIEGLFEKDENGNNKTLSRWADNVTSIFDPESYAQMISNVGEMTDPAKIAAAWEQAKTTLGLVKVTLPDTSGLDAAIQEKINLAQQRGENVEFLSLPDGTLEAVQIGGATFAVGEKTVNQMEASLAAYTSAEEKWSNMALRDAESQQAMLDSDLDAQQRNSDRFYQALGESNANNRDGYNTGLNLDNTTGTLTDYSDWRSPQAHAFDAIYGAPANTTLGEVGQLAGMIGGGFAHLTYDTTTDLMGLALTGAYLHRNPVGGISGLLSGNTLGSQFSTGAQTWADELVGSTGPGAFAGGFGNEQMKDGFEIGMLVTTFGVGGGINTSNKVVKVSENTTEAAGRFAVAGDASFIGPVIKVPENSPHYIPSEPLATRSVPGFGDLPLPHPDATGPHSVLGSRVGTDGVTVYRQTATFPESTWPKLDGMDVPFGRVDWTSHPYLPGPLHPEPHIHEFNYDFMNKQWKSGEAKPFSNF